MTGITKEEQECTKCNGMNSCYCDGPKYLGGLCHCVCHKNGNKKYEYNNGRYRLRQNISE